MNILDGSGVYRQDSILGPSDLDKGTGQALVPQIEEIRVIDHEGELYVNAKDLTIAMKWYATCTGPTLNTLNFIKNFDFELITARR